MLRYITGIHYLITVGTRSAIAETSGHTRLVYFRPRRVHCIDSAQLLLYGRVAWCVCICLGVRVGHESWVRARCIKRLNRSNAIEADSCAPSMMYTLAPPGEYDRSICAAAAYRYCFCCYYLFIGQNDASKQWFSFFDRQIYLHFSSRDWHLRIAGRRTPQQWVRCCGTAARPAGRRSAAAAPQHDAQQQMRGVSGTLSAAVGSWTPTCSATDRVWFAGPRSGTGDEIVRRLCSPVSTN